MKILNHQIKRIKLILVLAFFLFGFVDNALSAKAAESITFLVDPTYDTRGRNSVMATNRVTGLNAYYFIDDLYWESIGLQAQNILIANINALANEFDAAIYPQMHEFYGQEWSPGIDGDKKIYILLTDIKSNIKDGSYGGYFSTTNEYSKNLLGEYIRSQLEKIANEKKADKDAEKNKDIYAKRENEIRSVFTNEKELLYLNINFVDRLNMKSFLAHEFQHMINWHEKVNLLNVNEEVWLNEALSEYASTVLGYDNIYKGSNLEANVNNFNHNPSDSLTEWKNADYDYSAVNLFMQFLTGRYGNNILRLITTSQKIGIAAINDAVKKNDFYASFDSVFADWVITNYFNGQTIQSREYKYINKDLNYENLHISPTSSFMVYSNNIAQSSIARGDEKIKDWSGKWYQFISSSVLSAPNQILKIDLAKVDNDAKFLIPYVVKNNDGALILKKYELDNALSGSIYVENFGTVVNSVTIMPVSQKKYFGFSDNEIPSGFSYSASIISAGQPVIKNIYPKTSVAGNKIFVIITGENFSKEMTVNFGGVPATDINVVDTKTMIVKAPLSNESAIVDVAVIDKDSTQTVLTNAFSYLASELSDGALIRAEGDYKVYVVKGKYKRWIQSEKIFGFYNFKWSDIVIVAPETRDYYITSLLVRADNDYKVYEIGADNKKHHLSMSGNKFSMSGRKWEAIFIINDAEKNLYKTGAIITK